MNRQRLRRGCRLGALLTVLVAPSIAGAQQLPWEAGAGFSLERYTFADAEAAGIESLSLLTSPFAARVVVGPDVLIELNGGFAKGTLVRADGSSAEISGLTDSELRATLPLERGRTTFNLTGVLLLPSGHESHTGDEAAVAGAIASDLLPFRISNWGSGGGGALAASVGHAFGEYALGASAGYRVASEFEPLDNGAFGYQPGNELRIRLAGDHNIGEDRKASVHLTLFRYGEDRLDGVNLFRSGDRLQLVSSYAFPVRFGASAVAYAGVLHRMSGASVDDYAGGALSALPVGPSQTLLMVGSAARVPTRLGTFLPTADARFFRREDGLGQGLMLGVGGAAELLVGQSSRPLTLIPTARARFGNLMASRSASTTFTGFELGFTLRAGAAR